MLLSEGDTIRDTYEVERFLGEGAFAEVYRVRHRFLGRQAMKVFKAPGSSSEETKDRLSEALLLSRIGHPNIVRVFDAGVVKTSVGECGYFTMEHVAGGDLESFWRSHGVRFVPLPDVVEIMRQVCQGLAVAHSEKPPLIHRDIKPRNILVGYDAIGLRIRVSDFGLAKRVNPLTLLASARGTLAFKPPESITGVDSPAGDVWAIGSTLYLLLTDRLPFSPLGERDIMEGARWERPLVPPSRFNAQVDPDLEMIAFRALALKPTDRYADAVAMLDDLTEWRYSLGGAGSPKAESRADEQKSALGLAQPRRRTDPDRLAAEAMRLSQNPSRLMDGADIMEEALNRNPDLREQYEYRLRLWRRGLAM